MRGGLPAFPVVALAVLGQLVGVLHGGAAELTTAPANDGSTVAILTGDIAAGDKGKLKDLIRAANERNSTVSAIRLNSLGGNLLEGVEIAAAVRQARMATSVTAGSACASACFIVFAAGSEKFVSHAAWVGVHGASDKDGRESTRSNAATVHMARIVKELGVPPGIIGKMVVTRPKEMVWLTANDLRSMGVTMTGKPVPNKPAPTIATSRQPDPAPDRSTTAALGKPTIPWERVVEGAIRISASQNNGKPRVHRVCQPETKSCLIAIFYNNKEGHERLVRRTEDMSGKILSRDFCTFNQFKDIRTCMDWDSGAIKRSMKNPRGEWVNVTN